MSMVKYCRADHHFKNSNKLQIGTLRYYRESDNLKIADPQEGLTPGYSIHDVNKEITYDGKTVEMITAGGIRGGGMKISPGGRFTVNMRAIVPNQYIFCGTSEEVGCRSTAKSLGYNSWYKINDIEYFMRAAILSLNSCIRFSNPLVYTYGMDFIHGRVEYSDVHNVLDGSPVDPFLDAVFQKPTHSELRKDISFQKNNEYRLLWHTYDVRTRIIHDVSRSPILIDFTDEMKSVCS